MMKKIIISELKKMGYKVEEMKTVKNGVEYEGFTMGTETEIAPVFYKSFIAEMEEKNMSISEMLKEITEIYEKHKSPKLNIEAIFKKAFLEENLYIAMQKKSAESLIKRDSEFEGIEEFLYIRKEQGEDCYSIKLQGAILEKANMSESEAWNFAEKNTKDETFIKSLSVLMGFIDEDDESNDEPLYMISNESRTKGASAILNREKIKEFAEKRNIKRFIVFPSSIHEMLLMPYENGMNLDAFSDMVRKINNETVAPEERLTDRVYLIEL